LAATRACGQERHEALIGSNRLITGISPISDEEPFLFVAWATETDDAWLGVLSIKELVESRLVPIV
jgi:hypothetical protein